MKWRLGIDLGTNSLGWAVLELDDKNEVSRIIDAGARIFSDGRNPKDKHSNAVTRREARGARRNRGRGKNRQARLMQELISVGLMPSDETARKALEGGKNISQLATDPWILRCRALKEAISLQQIGRVIFHLGQRRGFKSNRKTDRANNEKGKVKDAIARTKADLAQQGATTLGELFGKPRLDVAIQNAQLAKGRRLPQPLARVRSTGQGVKLQYDYYPTRELILDEFEQIWQKQAEYHAETLTDDAYDIIQQTLAFQYPLKPQPIGKCTLLPEELRLAKAMPTFQRSRVYQEVNNLRICPIGGKEYSITLEQRDAIVKRLLQPTSQKGTVTFNQLRKLLSLSAYDIFNLESENRPYLEGDKTAAVMMQKERWGTAWLKLDTPAQDEIIEKLLEEENEADLLTWLQQQYGFDTVQAEAIADAPIPNGYGNLSKKAVDCLQPILQAEVITYAKAAIRVFGSHSNFATGELHDLHLPYYGKILERHVAFGSGKPGDKDEQRYGKIANPTVHVALNQVRAVVNDLIRRFKAPHQVVIEVARDLPLSAKGKGELSSQQQTNKEANESRKARLVDEYGVANTHENRLRLRLYDEMEAMAKQCIYSGRQIGLHELFSHAIEIDHILPFSQSLDDSFANKVMCTREANRDKGNNSPYQAFSHSPNGYSWEDICNRVKSLPDKNKNKKNKKNNIGNKHWRFNADAMEQFAEEGGFLARQLNDTKYIARLTKSYLEVMFGGAPTAGGSQRVWVVVGKLTADLRYVWNLDSVLLGHDIAVSAAQKKNRSDHRHHAIDAIVIGLTDRKLVKKAALIAQENEDLGTRLFARMPLPWHGFKEQVRTVLEKAVVSHKPDHGYQGAMLDGTAYGIMNKSKIESDFTKAVSVVTRKSLDDSKFFKAHPDLKKIRDPDIKASLLAATQGYGGSEFKHALVQAGEAMQPPVRRVRIIKNETIIPIVDYKTAQVYKGYESGSNYCYDIWQNGTGKWDGVVVSTYTAYQRAKIDPQWWRKPVDDDGKPLIMRLRKNDMLRIQDAGRDKIVRVVKFTKGVLALAEHFEANVDARNRSKDDELKYIFKAPSALQKANAIRITVSPSGLVKRY